MKPTNPALRFLCRYEARLDPQTQPIGRVLGGMRNTVLIAGGSVEGERLRGEVLPGGGDWALIDDTGTLHLDVRATFRTHDGALIHVTYPGMLRPYSPDLRARLDSGEMKPEDLYFRIAPRFETGAPAYAWLNSMLAIGSGMLVQGGVAYDIFEVL